MNVTATGLPNQQIAGSQACAGGNVAANGIVPMTGRSRFPRPPVDPETNITTLKARLCQNGASKEVVDFCDEVFEMGVTIEALETALTHEQCKMLDVRSGKQFQMFLEKVKVLGETKHICRLCPPEGIVVYKTPRDALRHFLKDHFGLWFTCAHW